MKKALLISLLACLLLAALPSGYAFAETDGAERLAQETLAFAPKVYEWNAGRSSSGKQDSRLLDGRYILAALPEEEIYITEEVLSSDRFGKDRELKDCSGIRLYFGDCYQKFDFPWNDHYEDLQPLFFSDLDGDRTDELVFTGDVLGGTGINVEYLAVFEPIGRGYVCNCLDAEFMTVLMADMCEAGKLSSEYALLRVKTPEGQTFRRVPVSRIGPADILNFTGTDEIHVNMSAQFYAKQPGVYGFMCGFISDYYIDETIDKSKCLFTDGCFNADVVYDGKGFALSNFKAPGEYFDILNSGLY